MSKGRHFLLIDIGNSRTKVALSSEEELLSHLEISTSSLAATKGEILFQGVSEWPCFDRVILASVVPDCCAGIEKFFGERLLNISCRTKLGIGIDYPSPETIGADRLANSAAAVHLYGAPAVVVDFGTALTFDVVDASSRYIGGVIAPGLNAMTDYLHQKTALLPSIELSEPDSVIGKSTLQAMLSGAVFGYRGLVEFILKEIQSTFPGKAKVIATGGYAELISKKLPIIEVVSPHLTLEGLRIVAGLNAHSG